MIGPAGVVRSCLELTLRYVSFPSVCRAVSRVNAPSMPAPIGGCRRRLRRGDMTGIEALASGHWQSAHRDE
jgi:hypothetical protein